MPDQLNIDREARRAERDRRRRKRIRKRRLKLAVGFLAVIALIVILFARLGNKNETVPDPEPPPDNTEAVAPVSEMPGPTPVPDGIPEEHFSVTENTATLSAAFPSRYAVLIDAENGEILAQRNSDVSVDPASMTKVLTLLVAVENIDDITGTWTMTREATDYCFVNKCSVVGYITGEAIPIEELFYGCILCSGADACLGLAEIAAGSHEAFVELMNKKLEELGISDTAHFTNCIGLPDENHRCTMEDMARIMQVALENDFCREILTTKLLISKATEQHPEGQALSNWFIRRIEDEDTGSVTVISGKTGWVEESGYCAVSYAVDEAGHGYLCATADSSDTWQAIYDHAELYKTYIP